MRLIFIILLFCGAVVSVQPMFYRARVMRVMSDFRAFQAKVAVLENGDEILSTGGENEAESFNDLMEKLGELHYSSSATALGVSIMVLSILGLALAIWSKKKGEGWEGKTGKNDAKRQKAAK